MLGDDTKKEAIIDDFNTTRGLGLTPAELDKLKKIGIHWYAVKPAQKCMASAQANVPAEKWTGIPDR